MDRRRATGLPAPRLPEPLPGSGVATRRARTLLAIASVVLVDGVAYALILPALPLVVRDLGGGEIAAAAAFALFSVCQLIAAPVLGRSSDRYGRRAIMLVSQVGTLLGFALLAVADSVWLLLAARMLDGATAGNLAVVNAALCDSEPEERLTDRFSMLNAASGAGFLIGLVLCAWLSSSGLRTMSLVACGMALITIIITLSAPFATPRPRGAPHTWKVLLVRGSTLRRAGMTMLTAQILFAAFAVVVPIFLHDAFDLSLAVSVLIGAGALATGGALQAVLAPRLARRHPDRAIVHHAFAVAGVGSLALLGTAGLAPPGPIAIGLACISTGTIVAGVLLALSGATSMVAKCDADRDPGALMGISQSLGSVGQLIGPIIAFLALGAAPWAFCIALGAMALLGVSTVLPRSGAPAASPTI